MARRRARSTASRPTPANHFPSTFTVRFDNRFSVANRWRYFLEVVFAALESKRPGSDRVQYLAGIFDCYRPHRASVSESVGRPSKDCTGPCEPARIPVSVLAKDHAADVDGSTRLCCARMHRRGLGGVCVSWLRIRSFLPSLCRLRLSRFFRDGYFIGLVCDGAFVSGTSRYYNYIRSWIPVLCCPRMERKHCSCNGRAHRGRFGRGVVRSATASGQA
jgi:hypothetical protein